MPYYIATDAELKSDVTCVAVLVCSKVEIASFLEILWLVGWEWWVPHPHNPRPLRTLRL